MAKDEHVGPVTGRTHDSDDGGNTVVDTTVDAGVADEERVLSSQVDDLIAEYDEERPARRLSGKVELVVVIICFLGALFVLNQVFNPLRSGNQYYLMLFLALVLPLVFLTYRWRATSKPAATEVSTDISTDDSDGESASGDEATAVGPSARAGSDNPGIVDWVLAAVALVVCLYPVLPFLGSGGFNSFLDRQGSLTPLDIVMGAVLGVLILEACRRTTGLILPAVCLGFFAYGYYGGFIPVSWPFAHAGLDFGQIINGFYNDQSGFYGTPLDVCATYIVLFTIYGAVLDMTGAGRFFINFSFAAFKKSKTAPGRTVALSGFLLGTVSGSGTATAVSLGSVAWPILRRAGYPRDNAGGLLAASGIGAILSPPTLGAAAFIIAEYLGRSYLDVLLWATIPTVLYYAGIVLAVEIDARRFGAKAVEIDRADSAFKLFLRFGYHFLSLIVIVVFLALDIPPFKAVVYATLVAFAVGLVERIVSKKEPLDPDTEPASSVGRALKDYALDLFRALSSGIRSVLGVAAVCAAAGIITSIIAKSGLGQSLAGILVDAAKALGGLAPADTQGTVVLILTAVFSALAILVLGLAVPVTASFIISWVVIGPALIALGATAPETAMFIFYYAVLSEVSPPTALAAVASAAITGGNSVKTMWQAAKYTAPAFLAPIAFVITENGRHLLMQGSVIGIVWTTAVSLVAVGALAIVGGGWIAGPATWLERGLALPAALLLLYLHPISIAIGLGLLAVAIGLNLTHRPKGGHDPEVVHVDMHTTHAHTHSALQ